MVRYLHHLRRRDPCQRRCHCRCHFDRSPAYPRDTTGENLNVNVQKQVFTPGLDSEDHSTRAHHHHWHTVTLWHKTNLNGLRVDFPLDRDEIIPVTTSSSS